MAHGSSPRRRSVLGAAAWSIPAVSVAGAAPALAFSPLPGNRLAFDPGDTKVVALPQGATPSYFYLLLSRSTVLLHGSGGPSTLSMTATFTPSYPGMGTGLLDFGMAPVGWSLQTSQTHTSVTFTYRTPVTGGEVLALTPDATYVGCEEPTTLQQGTFWLTFAADGFRELVVPFTTPGP